MIFSCLFFVSAFIIRCNIVHKEVVYDDKYDDAYDDHWDWKTFFSNRLPKSHRSATSLTTEKRRNVDTPSNGMKSNLFSSISQYVTQGKIYS